MADIKIAVLVQKTGFGPRYWQKKIGRGEVPGAKYVQIGLRRIFLVDETVFDAWWDKQRVSIPCQRTSSSETKHGGIVSSMQENSFKVHLGPTNSQSLKTVLKELSKS